MKSQRRHDLQTNELADALGHLIERVRPHARAVAVIGTAAVVALVVLVLLPMMRSRAAETAAAAFTMAVRAGKAEAVRIFLDQHGDAEQAPLARLLLADRLVAETAGGVAPGETDTARTAKMLAEAEALYTQVASADKTLEPLARVGLALVTLNRGQLDDGQSALKAVMDAYPQSIAAARAKAHVEALADYEPIVFSDEPLEEPPAPQDVPSGAAEAPADTPPAATDAAPAPPAAPAETPADPPTAPATDGQKTPKPVG